MALATGRIQVDRFLRRHGLAFAGYLVLTAIWFWPVIQHFNTRFLSDGLDGSQFLWTYWYIPRSLGRLLHLHNPFYTTQLFYPVGVRLALTSTTYLQALASWPLARLFGFVFAVNTLQLGAVVLSGFGAYLLALHECNDRRAAFVAGAAFTLMPYRFNHINAHFNLQHTEFIPLTLLAALLFYERPSHLRAAFLGAMIAFSILTDDYYGTYAVMLTGIVAVWHFRRTLTRTYARFTAEVAGMCLLICWPLVVESLRELYLGESARVIGWGGANELSTDLFSWIVPPYWNPLWGHGFTRMNALVTGGERIAYPGLLIFALAVIGALSVRFSRRTLWIGIFIIFATLAFGPFLKVNGHHGNAFTLNDTVFSIPMPGLLMYYTPILKGLRGAGRFAVVAILALDVVAAVVIARLSRYRRWLGWTVPAVALAITLVEFLPGPLSQQSPAIPTPYAAIAASSDRAAVMEIPMQWIASRAIGDRENGRYDTVFMYYATEHGRPLVNGQLSRYPDRRWDALLGIPIIRQVLTLQHQPGFTDAPTFEATDLRQLGIGFVVYHRDRPMPEAYAYFSSLHLPVLADDGTVIVWKVP